MRLEQLRDDEGLIVKSLESIHEAELMRLQDAAADRFDVPPQ
jgi:hypothetical protein